jgi:hypothetical protein
LSGGKQYISYPELTRAALQQKTYGTGLRYWQYLASFGVYSSTYSVSLVRDRLGVIFGIGSRQVYAVLRAGDGELWDWYRGTGPGDSGRIRVYSPDEVAKSFGLENPGRGIERDVREITGRSHRRGVYCALQDTSVVLASPTTRDNFKATWGVSVRTQQHYDRSLDIELGENFILVAAGSTYEECVAIFRRMCVERGPYRISKKRIYKNGKFRCSVWGIYRQIGNTRPGQRYIESERSKLMLIGYSKGAGIWIEKQLCMSLRPHLSTLLTSVVGEAPEPTTVRTISQHDFAVVAGVLVRAASSSPEPGNIEEAQCAESLDRAPNRPTPPVCTTTVSTGTTGRTYSAGMYHVGEVRNTQIDTDCNTVMG